VSVSLDPSGWIALLQENVPALYRWVSRRVGGDRELAEDVTQEVWLRAVEAWRRAGPPQTPQAWLMRVARNLLANHFRRVVPQAVDPADLDLTEREAEPVTPDAAALLRWGLSRLGSGQARLLEAYHLDGLDVAAIARAERLSARAVEGRLRRARASLRRQLTPYLRGDDR